MTSSPAPRSSTPAASAQRPRTPGWSDERIEILVGRLLQAGVAVSAVVTAIGGVVWLVQLGASRPTYDLFRGPSATLTTVSGLGHALAAGRGEAIILVGLLILVATPVLRVALLLVTFLLERDILYTMVSTLVLVVLLASIFW